VTHPQPRADMKIRTNQVSPGGAQCDMMVCAHTPVCLDLGTLRDLTGFDADRNVDGVVDRRAARRHRCASAGRHRVSPLCGISLRRWANGGKDDGDVAAVWAVLGRLGLVSIVDEVVGARRSDAGASVGTYLASGSDPWHLDLTTVTYFAP
jgi:hypothetical protein